MTRIGAIAAAGLLGLTATAAPASADGSFWDDEFSVHERSIEGIADEGITRGCDPPLNSQFCALRDVDRGQMAAFLNRALRLPAAGQDYFDDDDSSIFEDDINRLAAAGITEGCNPNNGGDRFCPDEIVSRGQMAAFLDRAYDLDGADTDPFADDEDSIFEANINRLAAAGVTVGCNPNDGGDRYCPTDQVRREQMASFLVRADTDLEPIAPSSLHERTVTYTVRAEGPSIEERELALLSRRAKEALYAEVSWNIRHRLLIEEVDAGGDFTLLLSDDDEVGEKAPVCSDEYSCTVGNDVFINRDQFMEEPSSFDIDKVGDYQRYLVLHETGHWLDFDDTADADDPSHYNDPAYCVGGEAPVMKQQSISLDGCSSNPHPLPFERDCVEEAWIADLTNQGDGDGDDDDQCPHVPTER